MLTKSSKTSLCGIHTFQFTNDANFSSLQESIFIVRRKTYEPTDIQNYRHGSRTTCLRRACSCFPNCQHQKWCPLLIHSCIPSLRLTTLHLPFVISSLKWVSSTEVDKKESARACTKHLLCHIPLQPGNVVCPPIPFIFSPCTTTAHTFIHSGDPLDSQGDSLTWPPPAEVQCGAEAVPNHRPLSPVKQLCHRLPNHICHGIYPNSETQEDLGPCASECKELYIHTQSIMVQSLCLAEHST